MSKEIIDIALKMIMERTNSINEMTTSNGAGAYSIPLTPEIGRAHV